MNGPKFAISCRGHFPSGVSGAL